MKYAVVDLEMCVVPKGYRKNRFKYRVDKKIGTVKRTIFPGDKSGKYNVVIENTRAKALKYIECADTSSAVGDDIKLFGYRGSAKNPYSGGSFSHK